MIIATAICITCLIGAGIAWLVKDDTPDWDDDDPEIGEYYETRLDRWEDDYDDGS